MLFTYTSLQKISTPLDDGHNVQSETIRTKRTTKHRTKTVIKLSTEKMTASQKCLNLSGIVQRY